MGASQKQSILDRTKAPTGFSAPRSLQPDLFIPSEFERSILEKGYDVELEKALRCPCISQGTSQPLNTCKNCGGTGYIFVNKIKTKMLLSSMGSKKNFIQAWTAENSGTVNLSALPDDRLAFMDRVTLLTGTTFFNQILYLNFSASLNKRFAILAYYPSKIESAYLFIDANEPLTILKEGTDFSITGNVFILDRSITPVENESISISIRYEHKPQYLILDILRDISLTPVRRLINDNPDAVGIERLPSYAIARRAHYILDAPQLNGQGLFDNSDYSLSNKCL